MKISRRQIRKLIKEEIKSHNDLEAFFSLLYAAQYVSRYNGSINSAWHEWLKLNQEDNSEYRRMGRGYGKFTNALERLDSYLATQLTDIEGEIGPVSLSARGDMRSIETEAYDGALIEFQEGPFKGVEEIAKMINIQTPIGISVMDALVHLEKRTMNYAGKFAIKGAAQRFVDLMNDDDVLLFMDEISK